MAEEIASRLERPKEELLIESLKDQIKEQDWVQEVFMTDDNGVEKNNPEEGTHLIVETKDGYELIVEVNNVRLIAKVVETGKASKEKYEITYIEEGKKEKAEVRKGFSIALKECNTVKQGYKFTGWCELENGESERFAEGTLYKPTKNTKLYAIFEEKAVTISFNANDGKGKLDDITAKPGQEIQLPNNQTITRQGYNFKCWNTMQNGRGTVYNNNSKIAITEDIILYAMWEESVTVNIYMTINNKLTEGTTIYLSGTAGQNIQNVELKAGNVTIYSENNIGSTIYKKSNIQLTELNNLSQLPFYDNIMLTFEITSVSGKQSKMGHSIKNYTISTPTQLTALAYVVNSGNTLEGETIIQLADIDVNPGNWTANADGTATFTSSATQWTIIGTADYDYDNNRTFNKKIFKGTYNGNQRNIEGVYINATDKDTVGLFGYNEGTIKNVNLKNSTIQARYQVGGIAGGNDGNIENCNNYASVSGNRCVGGICSWSMNALRNNTNYGIISDFSISNYRTDSIAIGGIAGWLNGQCSKCGNYATINCSGISKGISTVGGIAGATDKKTDISNSYNLGIINHNYTNATTNATGGIIGYSSNTVGEFVTISSCYNKGNITGSRVGGIATWAYYIKIQDCYNTGTLQCNDYVGGILGWSGQQSNCNGSIINSYNVGTVSGATSNRTGGVLADYGSKPILTNCYNLNTSSAYAVGQPSGAWGTLDNTWPDHIVTKKEEDMKNLAGTLGSNWSDDVNNINDGYPILKWQISS